MPIRGQTSDTEGASQIGYRKKPNEGYFYRRAGGVQTIAQGRLPTGEKTVKQEGRI